MSTTASKITMPDRLLAWKRRKQPAPTASIAATSRPRQRKPTITTTNPPPPPTAPSQRSEVNSASSPIVVPSRPMRSSSSPSTPPLPTRYADVFDAGEFIAGLSTPFNKPRTHAHVVDGTNDARNDAAVVDGTESAAAVVSSESVCVMSAYDVAMSASSSVVIVSAVTAAPSTARRFGADTFISPVRRSTRLRNYAGALTTPMPLTSQYIDTGALMSDANVIKAIGDVGAVIHNAALSNNTPRNKRTRSPQHSTHNERKDSAVELFISPERRLSHKLIRKENKALDE